MIYLNNNKFCIHNIKQLYDDEHTNKKTLINTIHKKLSIPYTYHIFDINNIYEAYTIIINSIILSFTNITGKKPHIILNKMEDPQILSIINSFILQDRVDISYTPLSITGEILLSEISKLIIPKRTCLIISSFINSYTGCVNDTKKIGQLAHSYGIPLFSDCVYSFGKYILDPSVNNIDIMTIDLNFPGISFIIINKSLVSGYHLSDYAIKFSSVVDKYTNNDEYIYGLGNSIILKLYNKDVKERLMKLKQHFIKKLNCVYYYDIIINKSIPTTGDILILGPVVNSVPHIITFLVITEKKIRIPRKFKICELDVSKFENIGIVQHKNILSIGLNNFTTKDELNKFIGIIAKYKN